MKLALTIDYWTDSVGTFDPVKVVRMVKCSFPEAAVDERDYQAEELNNLRRHIKTLSEPGRTTMLRQAERKAMDNGPCFHFAIEVGPDTVRGRVSRYELVLDLPDAVDGRLRCRVESFLASLKLGEVRRGAKRDGGAKRDESN